jgi:hypothetical protein
MCRNIRRLHNYEPPATQEQIRDAALQYVRKIAGFSKPSKQNEEVFNQAVDAVARETTQLLTQLKTSAPKRSYAEDLEKHRQKQKRRFASTIP